VNAFRVEFYDGSSMQLRINIGGDDKITITSGSNTLGDYNNCFIHGQWNSIQGKIIFSKTSGEVHIKLNGSTLDKYTISGGINTCQGSANEYINKVWVGNSFGSGYIDFISVWDSYDNGDG
jgi:hypothetical protein